MPRRREVWVMLAAAAAVLAGACLQAQPASQPENPVFVNDSPAAAETLIRVQEHVRAGNLDQAVRQLQRLLDENADALVVSPEDPALYVPVRQRVHAVLLAEAPLLARYRDVQQPLAADMLRQGRIADAERVALLTPAGFEAALRLAQEQMESAAFGPALMTLSQLDEHPDRRGSQGNDAAKIAVELARYFDRPEAKALAARWAAGAGINGEAAPVAPPARQPARSALDPSGAIDTSGIVPRPLWSAPYDDDTPVEPNRNTSAPTEMIPPFGRELRTFPTISGDSLYVAGARYIAAYNRFTLEPRWRVDAIKALGIDTDPWDREAASNRGMRRTSAGALEDLSSIAVRGSTVIAVMGLEPPGAGEGQEALVALDTAAGAVRWTRLVQTMDDALSRTHVRGPALIDGPVAVIGCRKWQPDRRLTALYMAGVDIDSGALRWLALVGSAGSLPYYRAPQIADAGALHDGVVYRLDRIGLLAAYAARTGRPLWVRRFGSEAIDSASQSSPWQANLPVVHGPWVMAVSPDRTGIVRVNRITGRLDGSIPSDKASQPAYVVSAAGRLACVSDNRLALVDIEAAGEWSARKVTLSAVVNSPGIRGRVAVAGDRLLVPTVAGMQVFDPADITRNPSYIDLDSAGNVMALGDQLLVVDDAKVHSYLSWDRADAILTQRVEASPTDLSPAVTLAELSHRAGKSDRLLYAIDAAMKALGAASDVDKAEVLRRRLFDDMTGMVEVAQGAPTPSPGPALSEATIAAVIDRLGTLARRPEERAAQLLLAGRNLTDRTQVPQAVAAYQRLLSDRTLAGAMWASMRGPIRAGDEATRRLEGIIVSSGRAAYGAFDAEARAAADALGAGASAEAMQAVAERFPVAQSIPALWSRIAAAYRDGGRSRAEARALEIGLQRAEGIPDAVPAVVGELAGRLVANLKQRGLLSAAAGALNRFQSRFPAVAITMESRPVDVTRLKAEVGAELLAQRRWPRAGAPTAQGAQIITGWSIMEPEIGATVGVAPPFVVLQAEDGRIALWGRPDGPESPGPFEPLWTSEPSREQVALIRVDRTSAYFYWATAAGGVVGRVDAASRSVAWKSEPFGSYFPPGERAGLPNPAERIRTALDGLRPITELLVTTDDRSIALVERSGRAVILDADAGNALWSGTLPLQRIVDCDLIASVLVVAGDREVRGPGGAVASSTPAVAAVDARTGASLQQFESASGPVRWLRLTETGDLVVGMQGAVACYDLENGQTSWKLQQGPAATSIDAWVAQDRLLLLGEDRSLWQVSVASGSAGAAALDTRGRFETSSHVSGAATPSGGFAFRSKQGVVVFGPRAELLGADAIGATDNLIVPAAAADGFVTLSESGTASKDGETMSYNLFTLDGTGVLKSSVQVALGAPPSRLWLTDGRIAVTAGRNTVVYAAPANP